MGLFNSIRNAFIREKPMESGFEVPKITSSGIVVGDYELCIPQGRLFESDHIQMKHGAFYTLLLKNHGHSRCDAKVLIDSRHVGTWRIPAVTAIELERPANDIGRFTFFKIDSAEAKSSQLKENSSLGLISVTFMPEAELSFSRSSADSNIRYSRRESAGGTGLSGASEQSFTNASHITHDQSAFVTINARLFWRDESIRPLRGISNEVPPPVLRR